MKITTIGIDLAKNVFQIHGVNEHGKAVLRKQLKRAQVVTFFANVPRCLIGWRPVPVRMTGRASRRRSGTRSS